VSEHREPRPEGPVARAPYRRGIARLEWAYFEANALCATTTRPEHLLIGLAVEPGMFLRRVMDSREIQISQLLAPGGRELLTNALDQLRRLEDRLRHIETALERIEERLKRDGAGGPPTRA
jgi:hypothetical protein